MTRSAHHQLPRVSGETLPSLPAGLVATPEERGITTAEYAVGTAAGAGLAGLLYKLLTSEFGEQLLRALFEHVLRLLGIG